MFHAMRTAGNVEFAEKLSKRYMISKDLAPPDEV
jgi:hypothetical protein